MHPTTIDETGNRYGKWTVIGRGDRNTQRQDVNGHAKEATWFCECDCGNTGVVRGWNLRKGRSSSCRECFYEAGCLPEGEAAGNQLLNNYKQGAKRRSLEWNLTDEQFFRLTKEDCHYCGAPPLQIVTREITNGDYIYNGIDRVDNSLGYTKDNCVACCQGCNRWKGVLSHEEFIERCLAVARNHG